LIFAELVQRFPDDSVDEIASCPANLKIFGAPDGTPWSEIKSPHGLMAAAWPQLREFFRSKLEAVRLSERGSFVLHELLKTRRLSKAQVEKLCCVENKPNAARFLLMRLQSLGLIRRESVIVKCKAISIYGLTEKGHRHVCSSSGRYHSQSYHREAQIDFLQHLLSVTDFYLNLVAKGAKDWVEVKQRAEKFEWFSSNEGTRIYRLAPTEDDRRERKFADPDVTIETETHRYLIEIERSTKTHAAVRPKYHIYNAVFSPLANVSGIPSYNEKYSDGKIPVVVFAFQSEERAANAKDLIDHQRANESENWYVKDLRIGSIEEMADRLRAEIILGSQHAIPSNREVIPTHHIKLIRDYLHESAVIISNVRKAIDAGQPVQRPAVPSSMRALIELVRHK